ncbi:amino acid permease [Saccharopolyspora subtropica]|uniref:APC family permease n=1 Tax=Saccharopolyspora thermophila TaxID=89367 RepID=A0A917K4G2_9PSEU|nr:APC family permease [Saccharopolyspora subtropica]GGI98644.1 amino acid permease [Saccharopolyspora subtropica]
MNTISEPSSASGNPDTKLKRNLGLWQLTLLGVSTQIGSGWLFAVLSSAAVAGPAAILSWIIGAIMILIVSLPWIELGTLFPRSGGIVRYPALSHGVLTGWITGWGYWIGTACLPAVEAQATLTYLGGSFPELGLVRMESGTTVLAWPNGILTGIAILAVFFVVNLFGVKLLAKVNTWVTIWKIVVPTITFVLLFFSFRASNLTIRSGFFPTGSSGIVHALVIGGIAFAYVGSRQVLDYAGEARNPERTIPLAIIGSCLIPMVVYLGLQFGFLGALDWDSAGVAPGDWSALTSSNWASAPLFQALGAAGFGAFATVLLIDAAVSPAGNGWVTFGGAARSSFGLGVDGYAPSALAKVNRFGTPWVSLLLALVVSALFMLPFPSWYQLVSVVSAALVLSYLMGSPIAHVLRRTAPHAPRTWRLPAVGFWAPVGYLAGLFIIYATGFSSLVQLLVITFAGLVIYGAYTAVRTGWIRGSVGWALSAAFLAAWIFINARGGWFMNITETQRPGSWDFPWYVAAIAVTLALYLIALRAFSTVEGRKHLDAGIWLITTLLAVLTLSYYGEFGPLAAPLLPDPYDLCALVVIAMVSYRWSVHSGFRTDQLDRALDDDTAHDGVMPRL